MFLFNIYIYSIIYMLLQAAKLVGAGVGICQVYTLLNYQRLCYILL